MHLGNSWFKIKRASYAPEEGSWEMCLKVLDLTAVYLCSFFPHLLESHFNNSDQFSLVQSLSRVWLFATPWTAAYQATLSITNSWSLLKLMSIESVMPSSHLILCHPFLLLPSNFPSIRVFFKWVSSLHQMAKTLASASVLLVNIQDWFPLGWTGWISLQSKGLSRVSSNTTVQKHQFFSGQLSSQSNSHIHTWPQEKPYPWLDGPLLAK